MKYGILVAVVLALCLLWAFYPPAEAEIVSTEPPLEALPATANQDLSSREYFRATMQEAKYLINSEDPRVWQRAMMSE